MSNADFSCLACNTTWLPSSLLIVILPALNMAHISLMGQRTKIAAATAKKRASGSAAVRASARIRQSLQARCSLQYWLTLQLGHTPSPSSPARRRFASKYAFPPAKSRPEFRFFPAKEESKERRVNGRSNNPSHIYTQQTLVSFGRQSVVDCVLLFFCV